MSYNSTSTADQHKVCPCCKTALISPAPGVWSCPDCSYSESTLPHIPRQHLTADTSSSTPAVTPMQYGWICPKCGAVMSPWTDFCPNCTNRNFELTYSSNAAHNSNFDVSTYIGSRKDKLGYE